jgi:glycosyltransferase involved in cell wall biosynthesis
MRVLVLASLFPHAHNETLGLSTYRRTAPMAAWCDLKVISLRTRNDLPERETFGGLDVIRPRWWRVPKLSVLLDGYVYAALAGRALRRVCPDFDPDLIDAHWLYPDGFGAVRLARRLGKPVVLNGRGSDVNEFCFRWPMRHFARRALRAATHLIAVSSPLKEKMIEAGAPADRITVVTNGVDTALYRPGDRDAARRALGVPAGPVILVSAGSVVEGKGFQHLIAGLALLPAELSVHLYIAGPGPYRDTLERVARETGVADRVTLLGRVAQERMPQWYRAADFFCFGSLREGCPNVVLESLACGTPVVSTRVGGVPDLVDEGRTGLLFEPGSPEAFARTLAQATARPWDRQAIAAHGASRSWQHTARECFAVFERVLEEKSRGGI